MNVILIEKNGNIFEKNVKSLDKLYSICGYRSNKEFELLHQWEFNKNIYELYGKTNGKKDKLNIYTFPFKLKEKYYGTLCIIKKNMSLSISLDEWNIFSLSFNTKSEMFDSKSPLSEITSHISESHDIPSIVSKMQRISISVHDNASVSNQSDGDQECDAECDHDYESNSENEDVYLDLDKNEDTHTNEEFLYPHIDELKYEEYEEEN